jgi:hypothetical protein
MGDDMERTYLQSGGGRKTDGASQWCAGVAAAAPPLRLRLRQRQRQEKIADRIMDENL